MMDRWSSGGKAKKWVLCAAAVTEEGCSLLCHELRFQFKQEYSAFIYLLAASPMLHVHASLCSFSHGKEELGKKEERSHCTALQLQHWLASYRSTVYSTIKERERESREKESRERERERRKNKEWTLLLCYLIGCCVACLLNDLHMNIFAQTCCTAESGDRRHKHTHTQ